MPGFDSSFGLIMAGLLVIGISPAAFCQPSSYTRADTVKINERRSKKFSARYWRQAYYDSVSGKLNGRVDSGYSKYDVAGRQIESGHVFDGEEPFTTWFFYNEQGQLVRQLSCSGDSTDGFIDTWTYDTAGTVISEKTFSRHPEGEELFRIRTFQYDSLNRLVKQVDTYPANKTGSGVHTITVKYSGNLTIKCDLYANGDTFSIDTSFKDQKLYWSRIYFFEMEACSNRRIKKQNSRYLWIADTIGVKKKARKRIISQRDSYLYCPAHESDTLYTELDDKGIEQRGILYIDEFVFDREGKFAYIMRRNRKGQPIYRRTDSCTYYQ